MGKGGDAETTGEQPRNNSAALGQGPGSPIKGYTGQGLPWSSSGQDSTLPMPGAQVHPGARVQSPTCMLQWKDLHASTKTWCSQINTNKNYPPKGYTQYFWAALHILMEKEMATHSSILAWRIPGTEEPGGLPSLGLHRVEQDWSDLAAAAAAADTESTTRWKKLTRT